MMLPASYHTGFAPRDGYPAYPELWRGCVGAWAPCLGPTGLTLRDWSGRQNHGTLTNMVPGDDWLVSGGRYALDFDGSNDLVDVGNIDLFNFGLNSFSVSMWLRAAPFAADRALLAKDDWDLGTTGLLIYTSLGAPNQLFYYSSGTTGTSFGAIANSAWRHVGVSRNSTLSGQTRLYLDGRLIATITDSSNYSNSRRFRIGNDDDGNRSFPGQIDNVTVYSRHLSDHEMRLLATRRGIAYEISRPTHYAPPISARRRKILTGQV